jgi:hypothetical protein
MDLWFGFWLGSVLGLFGCGLELIDRALIRRRGRLGLRLGRRHVLEGWFRFGYKLVGNLRLHLSVVGPLSRFARGIIGHAVVVLVGRRAVEPVVVELIHGFLGHSDPIQTEGELAESGVQAEHQQGDERDRNEDHDRVGDDL